MNKLKIYQWTTWSLLLLNILLVSIFFISNPKHTQNNRSKQSAKKEMNLTDEQEQLFLKSAEKHKQLMKAFEKKQHELWQSYFETLSNIKTAQKNEGIVLQLQKIEKQKIEITSTHFKEIKAFLKQDQYKGFTVFLRRLLERQIKKRKNKPPRPKDF